MLRVARVLLVAGAVAACAADPGPITPPAVGSGSSVMRPAPRVTPTRPPHHPDLRAKLKRLNEAVRQTRDKLGGAE